MSPGPPPPILPGSSRLGEELTPDLLRVQAQAPTPNTHACTHANMKQLGCARRRTGTHRHALTFLADGLGRTRQAGHHPDVSLRSSGHGGHSREHQHGPLTRDQVRGGGRPGCPVPGAAEPHTAGGGHDAFGVETQPTAQSLLRVSKPTETWAPEPAAWVYPCGPQPGPDPQAGREASSVPALC